MSFMDYQTVVPELFTRFPKLEGTYRKDFAYMEPSDPAQYIVFGSVLVPALASALNAGDVATILPICGFLEEASIAARADARLGTLIQIEIGEWLGWTPNEDGISPWLGPETKRICNYVEGLASQRLRLRDEMKANTISARIASALRK
jgi:hypothetical protein